MNAMDKKIDKYITMCSKIGDLLLARDISVHEAESFKLQWQLGYKEYDPDDTELFYKDNMLFLIPKEEKLTKPIKLIIA